MNSLGTWGVVLASPLAAAGVGAAVYGRLALGYRDGHWVGSAWAWCGYYGGITAAVVAAVLLIVSVVAVLR